MLSSTSAGSPTSVKEESYLVTAEVDILGGAVSGGFVKIGHTRVAGAQSFMSEICSARAITPVIRGIRVLGLAFDDCCGA
jgi:hypothetical protein